MQRYGWSADRTIRHLIDHLGIPTIPPEFTRQDESAGLALLDLGLNMGHVSRVTEGLVLVEEGSLRRSLAVDIDCRSIDDEQAAALRVRALANSAGDSSFLWIPIMRHSRQDLAPVVVRDAAGEIISTLTHRVALDATVAGLTRLFKLMITPSPETLKDKPAKDAARWLLLTCIGELVERGTDRADAPTVGRTAHRGSGDGEVLAVRAATTELWDSLAGSDAQESFLELLEVARSEYWVIAALPEGRRHHHLNFEAPLLRDSSELLARSDRVRRRLFGTGE